MSTNLVAQIRDALATFTGATRLYALSFESEDAAPGGLLVEAFSADEELQGVGSRDIIALSTNAYLDLRTLLFKEASLEVSLADRTRTAFHGYVTRAESLGSNGGMARYRLRITPWLWRLSQVRDSRAWENKTVIEIVESVFDAYLPHARWRWSDETGPFMDGAVPRSYCCQYRESDLAFITRLLTEEGLAWRFEDDADGHCMVLFSDSTQLCAVPDDATSAAGGGIRYHGARAGEASDTIQSLSNRRRLIASSVTRSSYDYKAKQIVLASVPTNQRITSTPRGDQLPKLEDFDTPGQYAYTNAAQARRYAGLHAEALEARSSVWAMRSTVRTLRAGTRFTMVGGPLARLGPTPAYTVLRVRSIGINNLPAPASQALAELFGPIPELLEDAFPQADAEQLRHAVKQAREGGYANLFDAIVNDVPWRPMHIDSAGMPRTFHAPTALGSQTALVVGANGQTDANGADELYCDALGRVRIRFHWQDPSGNAGCWVRVGQRQAGGGMGSQFLPRIGQEVLVKFIENDIDRPIIVGALYNGQGEGGSAPTPGGRRPAEQAEGVFGRAHDHMGSGQGNLASGNGPLWHGASGDTAGHRNSAAQWGVRSKEFGGSGYNQLLFDDTDAQGRVQLKSTHAATELNLGHLVHAVGNYRGSFRGAGAELRTDSYGSVRAGAGLMISSYKITHAAGARDAAGDNPAGIALMKQAVKLAETFDGAAKTHLTVGLASHEGGRKANASTLDPQAAPLPAMLKAVSGMVSADSLHAARSDADQKAVAPSAGKLPHTTDALVAIAAQAGLGVTASQSLQLASGETITLMSGQDSQQVAAGQMRVHTGQAIGMLGGAMAAGEGGVGLQAIAAQGAVEIQAQSDIINLQARDMVEVISTNAHIDWTAAKRISLSTAGGANITIEGGNITVQCPGKITVHAGKKSFTGPESLSYPMPRLPRSAMEKRPLNFKMQLMDTPGPNGHALAHTPWKIAVGSKPDGLAFIDEKAIVAQGETDVNGSIKLSDAEQEKLAEAYCDHPDRTWLVYPGHSVRMNVETESPDWDEKEKLLRALDAADFSRELHRNKFDEGAMPQSDYAKEAFRIASSTGVFPKIKT